MSAPENPAAFPCTGEGYGSPLYTQYGMTLRDWLAGQALSVAYDTALNIESRHKDRILSVAAKVAYDLADAMLAERAKATGEQP